MITIKPIEAYYSDDDKAIIARKAELVAAGKRRQSELAEVDAAITAHDPNPTPEDAVQNLIDGVEAPRPQPLSEKRTALQHVLRDIEEALHFMNGKERRAKMNAGARLAKDIRPQVDKAEKELVAALVIAHEKHLTFWQAKHHLIDAATGLNGLFESNVDDILGVPVNKQSPLADLFRTAVKANHLKSIPAVLR
jgi:hypothetical protein